MVGAAASPATTPPKTENQSSNQTTQTQESETKADTVETKTITETESIPFKKTTKEDDSLDKGKTALQTAGVNGVKTLTYEVTIMDSEETNKKLVKQEVTKEAVDEVTLVGTYAPPAPNCDPNYSPCVPNVSYDLDCPDIGFSVTVIGYDRHGFDGNDNDGLGCESY